MVFTGDPSSRTTRHRSLSFASCLLLSLIVIFSAGAASALEDAERYRLATSEPGSSDYAASVGIASLVKMNLMPAIGVDLDTLATSGFLESFTKISRGDAHFALLSGPWTDLLGGDNGGSFDAASTLGIGTVVTLSSEGEWSTQLIARNDVDEDVVYELARTIFENLPFLNTIDDTFASASLDKPIVDVGLPLHPGARRYLEETFATAIIAGDNSSPETETEIDANAASTVPPEAKTFVVYFDFEQAVITAEGAAVLDEVEAFVDSQETTSIWIAGYTDTTGSSDFNLGLAEQRADAVLAGLTARNILAREFDVTAFGERSPWIVTADQTREARNRRVEILVEPGADPVVIGRSGARQAE